MKHARRIGFILAVMLMVISFACAPAIAQQDEAVALDRRVGELYQAGKFSEGIPLAQQALAIREKALGPDHPDVATALSWLALLYRNQGHYADAELLYRRALAINEKARGPDHPAVVASLNALSSARA
jgi:tetratricopeptide (TPR) repeat protein